MAMEQCGDELSMDSTTTIGELDVLPPTPEMSSLSHETSPPKSIIKDLYIISPIQVKWTLNNPISSAGHPSPFLEKLPPHLVPSTQELKPKPKPKFSNTREAIHNHLPRYTISVLRFTFPLLLCCTSYNLPPASLSLLSVHLSKKKLSKQECEHLTKWLRKAVSGLELVYFNPNAVTLIPKSKLKNFIIQQRFKLGTLDTLNESLISQHAPNIPASLNGQSPVFPASFALSYFDSKAEEAGLIMPPTSP